MNPAMKMMGAMARRIVWCLSGLIAVLGWSVSVAHEQDVRVYSPTELIEMSDEIRADWHRILGKIEGALPDKAQAESVQEKLFSWLDDAGSIDPKTFGDAQLDLSHKLATINASFDAARTAGTLASWDPNQTSSQQSKSTINPGSAQSTPPTPSLTTEVPPNNASSDVSKPQSTQPIGWAVDIFTLVGGALGFFLYPRLFQPKSDTYFRSWFDRVKRRLGFTAFAMFCSYWLGFVVIGFITAWYRNGG